MIKTLIFALIAIEVVISGPDLCQNGIRLDSISYVDTQKMWFFTSGGHYWYIKESEFPPKEQGTPLPSPFTRGDAAIFKNTLDGCKGINPDGGQEKREEQEIHVIEHVNGKNQVLIYDVRTGEWSKEPQSIESYKDLTQAKIDWTKPIDAAFTHQKTYVVIIQDKKYSVVDIKPLCKNPDNFGESKNTRPITEFNHQDKIQATASYNDSTFLLFSKDSFWKVSKRYYSSDWRIQGTKGFQQDPGTEFFKYEENCKLPPIAGEDEEAPAPEPGPVAPPEGSGEEQPTEEAEAAESGDTEPPEDEKGFPWIIVIIVVIIVIILAIVLVACMAMRKKSDDNAEGGMAPGASGAGGSQMGSKSKSSAVSSAQSVRSKGGMSGSGSKAGSKMGSKTGAGGVKGASSSMGSSPSTMSVRSKPGLSTNSTSKVSKTGSKK